MDETVAWAALGPRRQEFSAVEDRYDVAGALADGTEVIASRILPMTDAKA